MKLLLLLGLLVASAAHAIPVVPACPATSGPLTLRVTSPRSSCISPCLIFFDATGTTDSSVTGNTTVFQGVTITWSFGDTLHSGRTNWLYGSNPGVNSRNTATGGVAAHLYITEGRDRKFTATATARDASGNVVTCGVGATAFDPTGASGFPGTATTCVSSSGTPVAGSGGCPSGAAVLNATTLSAAMPGSRSNKRTLFKCGDTFSGAYTVALTDTKWSVGAYGGCEDSQTGLPLFTGVSGSTNTITLTESNSASGTIDGRIANIEFGGTGHQAVVGSGGIGPTTQETLYNLVIDSGTGGMAGGVANSAGTQVGWIQVVMKGMTNVGQGSYMNFAGFNCTNLPPGTDTFNCGLTTPTFFAVDYQAILGSSFDGVGNTIPIGTGQETFRMSGCRLCVFSNSNYKNANPTGAVFKLHQNNTYITQNAWLGAYTEFVEISDNFFGGASGAQLVELVPQNSGVDERIRNVVVERNVLAGASVSAGTELWVGGQNYTLRDNAFSTSSASDFLLETRFASSTPAYPVQFIEIYNNSCKNSSNCTLFSTNYSGTPHKAATFTIIKNNLVQGGSVPSNNSDTNNTVSNNTTNTALDPGFVNGSGTLNLISDYQPTANFSGGTAVPVIYDALGTPWSPTWDLGAIHH